MSKKKLKEHRKRNSILLPCPICTPTTKSHLVVKVFRYHVYGHDVKWDGGSIYLNKEAMIKYKEKVYFQLYCNNGCDLNTIFHQESELQDALTPYIETLFQELVSVPAPPKSLPLFPKSKNKEKKYTLRLVPRQVSTEVAY